jgi:uncharacterized membrane protein
MARFASMGFVSFLFGICLLACGDKQNPLGESKGSCGIANVSYAQTIAPMMAASCTLSGCHVSPTPVRGIALDTYDGVKTNAAAANAEIQAKSMPIDPGAALSDSARQTFAEWVACGAPNN